MGDFEDSEFFEVRRREVPHCVSAAVGIAMAGYLVSSFFRLQIGGDFVPDASRILALLYRNAGKFDLPVFNCSLGKLI